MIFPEFKRPRFTPT